MLQMVWRLHLLIAGMNVMVIFGLSMISLNWGACSLLGTVLTPSCSPIHLSEYECVGMLDRKHLSMEKSAYMNECEWGMMYKVLWVLR